MAERSNGTRFDPKLADSAVRFVEDLCHHWQGEWAGKPFVLADFQKKPIRDVFGTLRVADGLRQYRELYLEVAKKNGKTPWAAALALILLVWDGEPGAEIYSAAADRDQASLIFQDAQHMVMQSDELSEKLRVYPGKKRIVYQETSSFFQVLSADVPTKHGLRPHAVIFDELHAQPDRRLWDTLTLGVASRREPLVVSITTAGVYNPKSIGWQRHEYADKVIRGVIDNPEFYAVIHALDADDDWTDEKQWPKANPNLGVSVKLGYLRSKCREAQDDLEAQAAFRMYHCNQWQQSVRRAIDIRRWNACDKPVQLEISGRCWIGLDLSSKLDLTAAVAVFQHDDGTYSLLPHFWIPAENLEARVRRDGVPYERWQAEGYLTATDGNVVDQESIRKKLSEWGECYDVQEIAFDPWNASQMSVWLQEDGFQLIEMRQGYKTMSEPTKGLLGLVKDKRLRHGGNPVLRWNADNLQLRRDPNDNVMPMKGDETQKHRIDGIVAAVMGIGRAILDTSNESVYESRELGVIG